MTSTELQKAPAESQNGHPEAPRRPARVYTPRVDIVETDDVFFLYADLPGVKPGDVLLHWQGGELTLHARCEPRHAGRKFLHAEYGVGDFYRTFTVAEQVDCDRIEASLAGGVLTVRVPKAESVRPKRIKVTGG
jgi:HSP20 family protein